jgi:hypothetical protein
MLGDRASEATIARMTAELGLDQPIWTQFVVYLEQILRGEMGRSLAYRIPVTQLIAERLPVTIALAVFSTLIALTVASQIWLPGGGWLFGWPLLAALLIAAAAPRGALGLALAALGAFGVFALAFQTVALSYVSLGAMTPGVMALTIPFAVALLGPVAASWSEWRLTRPVGGGLLALGLAGAVWLALSDGFTPRTPRPGDLFHLTDVNAGAALFSPCSSASHASATTGPLKSRSFGSPSCARATAHSDNGAARQVRSAWTWFTISLDVGCEHKLDPLQQGLRSASWPRNAGLRSSNRGDFR